MKNKILNSLCWCVCYLSLGCIPQLTNAQSDSTAKPSRESLLYLQYHVKNNQVPYLKVQTKNKTEKGFMPATKIPVSIYLDSDSLKDALVAQVVTDDHGEAIVGLPPTLAANWSKSDAHSFIANAAPSSGFDATTTTINVTIAKLEIDTMTNETGRMIVAHLSKKEGSSWIPVPETDLRLTVKRHGGYLNIGDKDAYTTDSTGSAEGEFQLKDLPGDSSHNNLELTAFVDDNEEVGSMETAMQVPWGAHLLQYKSEIENRSLWATGTRAPAWLIVMATCCIVGVWSVIIYLFTRIRKIWKLSMNAK